MGLYEKLILPRLLDLTMRNHRLAPYREQAVGAAQGDVLDIGVGSGLNLSLYGAAVARVVALDPAPELLRLASKRRADVPVVVFLLRASADQVPFADAVFDTALAPERGGSVESRCGAAAVG